VPEGIETLMTESKPKTVLRSDYRPPDYTIEAVDLRFDLAEDETRVDARLEIRRQAGAPEEAAPLVRDGE